MTLLLQSRFIIRSQRVFYLNDIIFKDHVSINDLIKGKFNHKKYVNFTQYVFDKNQWTDVSWYVKVMNI